MFTIIYLINNKRDTYKKPVND